ncbi:MAG: hypothetical protein QM820_01270 [Minicystis sp.]
MRSTLFIALTTTLTLAASGLLTACGGGTGGTGGTGGQSPGTGGSGGGACDKLPAAGLTQVLPPDPAGGEIGYGAALAILPDGAPIIAYGVRQQGAESAEVLVVRWDRCTGAWAAPVKVDDAFNLAGIRPIGIAVDPSDGRVGVTYEATRGLLPPNPTHQIFVALSTDGGRTFTPEPVSRHCAEDPACTQLGDEQDAFNPQIALAGGKTHVAYNQALVGCGPADGADPPKCQDTVVLATKDAGAWTREAIRDGVDGAYGGAIYTDVTFPPSVAVDAAGVPGVLAFQHPNQSASPISYTWALYFARPGAVGARVLDSKDVQNDVGTGSSSLLFDGTKVRALAHLHDQPAGTETHDLLFAESADGLAWSAATPLPRDGDEPTASSQALVADGQGGLVAVAQAAGGSTNQFGSPKILRSADGKAWSLGGASDAAAVLDPRSVTAARGADGKLYIAFQGSAPKVTDAGGVVLYREP